MNDFVRKSLTCSTFWYLELILLLIYGVTLGYQGQRLADSGQRNLNKLVIISTAGFVSFLIGSILGFLWKKWRPNHMYWVSAPIIGTILFSLLFGVVWFVYSSSGTVSEILSENAGFFAQRIVLQSIFFSIPVLILLALPRIAYIFLRRGLD